MKTIFKPIRLFVVLVLLAASGCKKEKSNEVETTITAVKLLSPSDQTTVNLNPYLNAAVYFEWESAKTGNYTLAYYKVQFDQENADFSKPVYAVASSGNGSETRLTLAHKELLKVAETIGIQELQTGRVRWRVISGNGVISSVSASGILLLNRLPAQTAIRSDGFTHELITDKI